MIEHEIICLFGAILLAGIIHEFGHFLSAKIFGETIKFRFSKGYIPKLKIIIPRFIWEMPERLSSNKKKIVALAGFGLEFLMIIPMILLFKPFGYFYLGASIFHLLSYKFYAGENSDFQWLKKQKRSG